MITSIWNTAEESAYISDTCDDYWEGSGHGIYYEVGNGTEAYKGLGAMFKSSKNLKTVYISQSGLDSFNAAVEREVNILDMWTNSKCNGFTVK